MNTLKLKISASLVIAGLLVVVCLFALAFKSKQTLGSVSPGGEYQSTTTPTGIPDLMVLCEGPGVLANINVMGPNVGNIQVYNATTSNNTLRASIATSSILLADIPSKAPADATSTARQHAFDAIATKGILVDLVGSVPTTTISYRCY